MPVTTTITRAARWLTALFEPARRLGGMWTVSSDWLAVLDRRRRPDAAHEDETDGEPDARDSVS